RHYRRGHWRHQSVRRTRQHSADAWRRADHGSHRKSHRADRPADPFDRTHHRIDRARGRRNRRLPATQMGDRMTGVKLKMAGSLVIRYRLLAMLAIVAILGGITLDDYLTVNTLRSILDRAAVVGFLALALTPLLIAG